MLMTYCAYLGVIFKNFKFIFQGLEMNIIVIFFVPFYFDNLFRNKILSKCFINFKSKRIYKNYQFM